MGAIAFSTIFLISSCVSTAKNLNHISVGMTKAEVMTILGEPRDTRASEGVEYMIYKLRHAPSAGVQATCAGTGVYTLGFVYMLKGCQYSDDDYFVQLREGKVTAYGRIGDFDSTQKPEATININKTVKEIK